MKEMDAYLLTSHTSEWKLLPHKKANYRLLKDSYDNKKWMLKIITLSRIHKRSKIIQNKAQVMDAKSLVNGIG